jgi:formylmethanofuran dehydrogenase subunit E
MDNEAADRWMIASDDPDYWIVERIEELADLTEKHAELCDCSDCRELYILTNT